MFGVVADHTCTGAWLMFSTGPQLGEAIGEYQGDPLYHASLSAAEYVALAAALGLEMTLRVANMRRLGPVGVAVSMPQPE